ncbi:Hypothetical protein NTJ_15315 [Nesidiocoris tenuis]|uniref:Uncharacterized protein n=1 Tax=Nesidiocoris tenuis TaxID=355587 RepID=A0ABN7BH21_9HEMI|nr:Hypothetical protein NTJ_15315 [Nesidiocoris tenuis]
MNFLVFALFAFIPAILADAPATPSLQEVIKEGQEKFDKAIADIKKNIGLSQNPNGEEIVKLIKEKNEKLAKDVSELGKKIEDQIKANPDAKAALDNVKAKLKEAQEKLRKENPDIAKNADKLGESLKSSWDSVAQEIEKSYKEFSKKGGKQEELENFFKGFIDQGAKAVQELKDSVDKVLKSGK